MLVISALITASCSMKAYSEKTYGKNTVSSYPTVKTAAMPRAHAGNSQRLQSLIDQTKAGGTLILSRGIYEGPVTVYKPIKIRAEEGAVLRGSRKASVLYIRADHVAIEGLTIENSGANVASYDAGISVQGKDIVLFKNKIQNTAFGIYLNKCSGATVSENLIYGNPEMPLAERGNGIQISRGGRHKILHNTMADVQDGIYFDQTMNNQVEYNAVKRSRYGFHLMFSDGNQLIANQTTDSVIGAMVMSAKDILLVNNEFFRQLHVKGCGLFLVDTLRCTVKENKLLNNTAGIALDGADHTRIEDNIISQNAIGVKRIGQIEATHFTRNTFIGNVRQIGGSVDWPANVWSQQKTGNYWDDYKGWDFDRNGIGDSPYRLVDDMLKVIENNPLLGIFYASPLQQLIEQLASDHAVFDEYPLMTPPGVIK
ncbi:nitrous oxide reductase family maturation protein NosD [Aneurinibacillus terranovensis]|uniref:nitrous oxide reductase family maturation protein NosD n=1 Tax=Aneurinibacillus terranovensis TaxID=278991 RepID=UPI000484E64D|nr:nitrous oxide reductase family maturation protein NosD [Aneurinibacillus terranovensis]